MSNQDPKTIIVLTDFSSCARNAAEYSLTLAHKFQASLLLFHSYFIPVSTFDNWPDTDYPALRKNSLSKLHMEAERLNHLASASEYEFQPKIECLIEGGSIAENISNLITERHNILMVVMGGYRARNNDDFQYGTVISDILGQARCPAVIVPEFAFLTD
jgi:nucleotide-binding universal stress UspA family protein